MFRVNISGSYVSGIGQTTTTLQSISTVSRQMLAALLLTECQAASMSLTIIRIAMRIGMPCAFTIVGALGIFIVIRHMAWIG